MKRFLATALIAASAHIYLFESKAIAQSPTASSKGCPLEIAMREVDSFVEGRITEYARISNQVITEMEAVTKNAKKPGVALSQQLSASEISKFNELRHRSILLGVEELKFSDFKRDVHVIVETYNVSALANLYEMKKETMADANPRRFYFTILEALRIAQPRTSRTQLINVGMDCDPEAGLYFMEEFNQQQLAKYGADQRIANLVFDIERLRTLYQLCWNLLIKGVDDVRNTKWEGDNPKSTNTMDSWIGTSGSAIQNMYAVIIPYIDEQLPSEKTVETLYMQTVRRNADHDFPAKKQ
jgi:hypothetical protein